MKPGQHTDKFKRRFLEKSQKRYGDQFTYEKVVYTTSANKVVITCADHGDFECTPNNFLHQSFGCRACAKEHHGKPHGIVTKADFIAKATEFHGLRYDYDKVSFDTLQSYIVIICPKHGEFTQQAKFHLKGSGCKRCNLGDGTRRYDTQAFIKAAKTVHGEGKYDYYMVEYLSGHEKVAIVCPKHGLFEQEASGHLSGAGCPLCADDGNRKTAQAFIENAQRVHGSRYSYAKVVYVRASDPVTITCGIHGDFQQRPNTHLAGCGCQRCFKGPASKKCADWLALVAVQTDHHIQHAENGGEYRFPEMHKRKADGFDETTNTVYEYNGSLWHAEPRRYPADRSHPLIANKTCGEVYQKTLDRDEWIRDQGYTLVTMWEMDWDAAVKAVIRLQRLWRQRKGISIGRKRVR